MTEIEKLYEDRDVIVAVKPAGLLSAPAPGTAPSLETLLASGGTSPVSVTRLDRGVGGVSVLAKNGKAMAKLSALVQDHCAFVKEYLAVVEGNPEEEGILSDLLFHDASRNKTFVVDRSRAGVKEARLCYRTVARTEQGTLVQIRLYTGRTHQIRAQFSSRGMPLCGDGKYGSRVRCPLALYAFRVAFPVGNTVRTFAAPVPEGAPWDLFPPETYAAVYAAAPLPADGE